MAEPLVVAEDFTYSYPESSGPALRDLSLSIEPSSFTVLAGNSGSGKSTLIRALCGLVPHFHGGVASGELSVGGLSVRGNGPADLAGLCGTVFQDPETQVVMGGVKAELELPLQQRGGTPAMVGRAVEEVALALGVAHLLDRRTETLSGGELQRVAIAAALAHRPALLLLDEPTSQLDPVAGDELIWTLRRLNEEWGTAVVVAEHRLERCLPAADRVCKIGDGALSFMGPPAEFLEHESGGDLATPVARMFALAGIGPPPASVKAARSMLRDAGLAPEAVEPRAAAKHPGPVALGFDDLWYEIEDGPAVLRGLDLELRAGERVALMGRNGAGKSTLLRLAKGLIEPTRGKLRSAGAVALLLQNPGDYLIHERAVEEAGPEAVAGAGLAGREDAHPRDLSGGERERLALEVVLAGGPYAAVLLDEPTRGMDPSRKRALAGRIGELAEGGAAVMVATHDTAFAAEFADRVVLLGQGEVIADGGPAEVLGSGWHFSTEVARALDGAALTAEDGARLLQEALVP
ncbi:MAG TPA: ATP-binding cassette domain-containing protein [Thermoleophilaceae bacterium]